MYVFPGIDVWTLRKENRRSALPLPHFGFCSVELFVAIITRSNHLVVTDSGWVVLGLAVDMRNHG